VLRNADGTMKLTLEDLEAGRYEITTYHHSTYSLNPGSLIDINMTDSDGFHVIGTDVPLTVGRTPDWISTQTFLFNTDGSDVLIDFIWAGSTSDHNNLSGFMFVRIPEPASVGLMAFGAVILLPLARRRRRR